MELHSEKTMPLGWRDRYLAVSEAAAIAGLTPKALYNRIYRGEGPCVYRMGETLRIFGGDLESWICNRSLIVPTGIPGAGKLGRRAKSSSQPTQNYAAVRPSPSPATSNIPLDHSSNQCSPDDPPPREI